MPIEECPRPIVATAAAKQALERMRAEHGEIILHVTGGCCDARTPLCLPAGALLLGPRDILLGTVEGVRVYEMQSTPEICFCTGDYVLDVRPGVPVGFSLDPGEGMRFAIREVMPPQRPGAACCGA